jgi:DNA-binding GntR family transcriptional regulator
MKIVDNISSMSDDSVTEFLNEQSVIAYLSIREKILSLQYKPGFQLKEIPLAQEYDLSRSMIRKAIARLAGEGLVKTFPNRGAFVTSLTREEVEEIFEVREAIEIQGARLATRRANRDELDRIDHRLIRSEQSSIRGNLKGYYLPEMDFHHEIMKLSKNKTLITIWEGLQTKLHLLRIQSAIVGDRYLKAIEEHKEILASIYQNRPDETEKLLVLHIRRAKPDYSVTAV